MSFVPGKLWYPYTPLTDSLNHPPLEISHAQGIYLYDKNDRRYIDGIASWWCSLLGHRHPHIVKAIADQLNHFEHISLAHLTHQQVVSLTERLVELTPDGLNHVFFSDNGSTAVEVALKICMQRWQLKGLKSRRLIVGFEGGYHGDTLACMAAGGSKLFHHWFKPWFFESAQLPSPSREQECLTAFKKLISQRGNEIAAVIIEPLLQAAGGMLVHSPETLATIFNMCQQEGIPFIADEIAVGFGRSGTMWAVDQAKIVPDVLCVSKGLTGGTLPLAATVLTTEMVDEFIERDDDVDRTFYHGHTYTGNALACAAANAIMDLVNQDDFLTHIGQLTQLVEQELKGFEEISPLISTRQVGPVGIVEVSLEGKRPLIDVFHRCLEKGLYLRPLGNLLYFWPPLIITQEEYRHLMSTARDVLANYLHSKENVSHA